MPIHDDLAAARAWVLARFDRPDADDLDTAVCALCERDPSFAATLRRAIEDRVELYRRHPSSPPGSYKRARGVLRPEPSSADVPPVP